MRILKNNELSKVNGGVCEYDYNTQKALNILSNRAAAEGYSGLESHQNAAAEIVMRATYINCR